MLKNHPEDKLICVDALTYAGNPYNLKEAVLQGSVGFVDGDIADAKQMEAVFAREAFDVVVNFAAESHVDRSIEDPGVFLKTNVLGTQVLLDAARKFGVGRFHQVSTDEVYGDLPLDRTDLLFIEDSPLLPSSPYAASKAAADLLVLAYHRTYGLPVSLSRCSNNYGPNQFPEKLIPLMVIRAYQQEYLPVYGEGRNVRDWIHVEDHCEAIDLIVRRGKVGEVYNIGANQERNNLQVVKTILEEMSCPLSLIAYVPDRAGHDLRYAIDAKKMKDELGWQAKTSFEEGLSRTISWYLNHPQWWEDILSKAYLVEQHRWKQDMIGAPR